MAGNTIRTWLLIRNLRFYVCTCMKSNLGKGEEPLKNHGPASGERSCKGDEHCWRTSDLRSYSSSEMKLRQQRYQTVSQAH